MKISTPKKGSGFTPIHLDITIETEEEAKAIFAIFNYSPNTDLLPDWVSEKVTNILAPYEVIGSDDEIANGIPYNDFYKRI